MDRPGTLRQALTSVRALEGDDLQLELIVSDNSAAGTAFATATEFGAKYVRADTPGPSAARNAGFRIATGDYILFLDDDDLVLPTHVRPHLEMLDEHPEFSAVYGQVQLTDSALNPNGDPYPSKVRDDGDRYREFFQGHPQIGVTVSRMTVRESVGFFREDLISSEDWEWSLRLAEHHLIGFVPVPSILFRQRPMGTHDELQWERLHVDTRAIIEQYRHAGSRRPPLHAVVRILLRSRGHFSWYFVHSSIVHSKQGERSAQRRTLYRAFRASPVHATINLAKTHELQHAIAAFFHGFGM